MNTYKLLASKEVTSEIHDRATSGTGPGVVLVDDSHDVWVVDERGVTALPVNFLARVGKLRAVLARCVGVDDGGENFVIVDQQVAGGEFVTRTVNIHDALERWFSL